MRNDFSKMFSEEAAAIRERGRGEFLVFIDSRLHRAAPPPLLLLPKPSPSYTSHYHPSLIEIYWPEILGFCNGTTKLNRITSFTILNRLTTIRVTTITRFAISIRFFSKDSPKSPDPPDSPESPCSPVSSNSP